MQEEVSALEDWAERWLELSVMPLFRCQQASTPAHTSHAHTAPAGSSGAGSQGAGSAGSAASGELPAVSVSSYLNSPKVAVFNQVGLEALQRCVGTP